jgi:hypothetical protein
VYESFAANQVVRPCFYFAASMMLLMPPGPNTKFVRAMLGKLQRTTTLDRSAGKMTLYEP